MHQARSVMHQPRHVADRVAVPVDGSILEEGSPEQVFEHPDDPRARASSMGAGVLT